MEVLKLQHLLTSLQGCITPSYWMSPVKSYSHPFSDLNRHIARIPSSHNRRPVILTSGSIACKACHHPFFPRSHSEGLLCMPLLTPTFGFGSRGLNVISHKQAYPGRFQMYAGLDVATAVDVINDLGFDTLTFLAVTVMVIPPFKTIRASPVSLMHFHFSHESLFL